MHVTIGDLHAALAPDRGLAGPYSGDLIVGFTRQVRDFLDQVSQANAQNAKAIYQQGLQSRTIFTETLRRDGVSGWTDYCGAATKSESPGTSFGWGPCPANPAWTSQQILDGYNGGIQQLLSRFGPFDAAPAAQPPPPPQPTFFERAVEVIAPTTPPAAAPPAYVPPQTSSPAPIAVAPPPSAPVTSSSGGDPLSAAVSLEAQASALEAQGLPSQAYALRQQAAAIRSAYGLPQLPGVPASSTAAAPDTEAQPTPPPAPTYSSPAPSLPATPPATPEDSSFFSSKDIVGIAKSATSALTTVGTSIINANAARAQARSSRPLVAPAPFPAFRPTATVQSNTTALIAVGAGVALLAVVGIFVAVNSRDDEDDEDDE